jgi:hypothetical protein
VLTWVDPVRPDGDRTVLDALLRDAAAAGAWIGSHPDVIAQMGTKEVLYTTRGLGWGADTHLSSTPASSAARSRPGWPPMASGCSSPAAVTAAWGCGR